MEYQLVVGAAIIREGTVLAAQRADPVELRGRWEFPGGKVDPGERPLVALVRECREELGVRIRPLRRIGGDVDLPVRVGAPRARLRLWSAEIVAGEPRPLEHLALRWLDAASLTDVDWLPADLPFLPEIVRHLRAGHGLDPHGHEGTPAGPQPG